MSKPAPYQPSPVDFVRQQVEQYEASNGAEGNLMGGKPVIILTTIGARTGAVRKTPLMRVEEAGRYAVIASKGGAPEHPQWFRNIEAHPVVELQDGPAKSVYRAHVASGAERSHWWALAVQAWPDYAKYAEATAREIPVVVLDPQM
jgi:deazaflavin-dependent oxidoreductase (nitroreductase family)